MRRLSKALSFIVVFVTLFSMLIMPAKAETEYLSDNLIPNGDFTLGKEFWSNVEGSQEIKVTIINDANDAPVIGKPYVDIEILSGYPSYSISRPGYYPKGKYKASFWMKKDNSNVSPYNFQPMNACNDEGYWYSNYGTDLRGKLTSEWQYFEYYVDTPSDNWAVNFSMQTDNRPGHLYLADVKVQRVLDAPEEIIEPVYATIPPAAQGVDRTKKYIYIFAGQSNMVGLNNNLSTDTTVDPRITKMDLSNYSNWLPGVENINNASSTMGGGTSPAKSIAEELIKVVPKDVSIGLVGCASPGTSLAQWQKDATDLFDSATGKKNLYNRMLERIKEAQKVGVVKGVFWHQGEADSGNGQYEQQLTKFINQLRADVGIEDLPFIMGQIGTDGSSSNGVNAALRYIKYFVKNTNYATSEGMTLVDNVHYDAASQIKYGKRYAAAYLALNPDLGEGAYPTLDPNATPEPTPAPTPTPVIPTKNPDFYPEGLLVYEPFDGEAGIPLEQYTPSEGFSHWDVQNNPGKGYEIANANMLKYDNLAVSGNYAIGGEAYVVSAGYVNTSASALQPYLSESNSSVLGKKGTTLWISFLMRMDSGRGELKLNNASDWWTIDGSLVFGKTEASASNISIMHGGKSSVSNVAIDTDTKFYVFKYEFVSDSSTKISCWINPKLDRELSGTADMELTTDSFLGIKTFRWYPGSGNNNGSLDEIRIGTSFAAVAPVIIDEEPTEQPTQKPTEHPTATPTSKPIVTPTIVPTVEPTLKPTAMPTDKPIVVPTVNPTILPTTEPTLDPLEQAKADAKEELRGYVNFDKYDAEEVAALEEIINAFNTEIDIMSSIEEIHIYITMTKELIDIIPTSEEKKVFENNQVKKIKFIKKKIRINVGKKATLKVKISPRKLSKKAKKVKWSINKKRQKNSKVY